MNIPNIAHFLENISKKGDFTHYLQRKTNALRISPTSLEVYLK